MVALFSIYICIFARIQYRFFSLVNVHYSKYQHRISPRSSDDCGCVRCLSPSTRLKKPFTRNVSSSYFQSYPESPSTKDFCGLVSLATSEESAGLKSTFFRALLISSQNSKFPIEGTSRLSLLDSHCWRYC